MIDRADGLVALMAAQIENGAVVATGVVSPLALLAIAVARRTHAPGLTYIACVGALDPDLGHLHGSAEDLAYLAGRRAEVTIPDLFDHARRERVDTIFFGAAEVDPWGNTNMSAAGSLEKPRVKFPGVAGAATLRRWVKRPVLVVPRQSKRSLVERVQVVTTSDSRPTLLLTDLGAFEVGPSGAMLLAVHPWATEEEVAANTGFAYRTRGAPPAVTPLPGEATLRAIRAVDSDDMRHALVG